MNAALDSFLRESQSLAVARADDAGRVVSANAVLERLARRPLSGRHASELVAAAQRSAFLSLLAEAHDSWSSLHVGLSPDERGVPSDYRAWALRDDTGILLVFEPSASHAGLLNAELIAMNEELVTMERGVRRRRDELAGQNERLRELDRLKDEFVSLVSHEFQTPLTSIRGYVQLLLEDAHALDEKQAGFLRVVDRNVDRLLRLVNDLLFVAQLDSGGLELDAGPVDVGEVVSECIDAIAPLAQAKEVVVSAQVTPVSVSADRRRLAQLVDNLLTNAVKFTPAGGHVDVEVSAQDMHAAIEVRDTGIGIPAEEQRQVFDRFFRASAATRRAIGGSGLGLAVAKSIADAHGGTISLESSEGAGSTFRVQLPSDPAPG